MKLAGKRSKGLLITKISAIVLSIGMLAGFLVPMVRAEGSETVVAPGAGTLKAAVQGAHEGDTLKLQNGSYTGSVNDRVIDIDKSITIEGVGGINKRSIVDVPFRITKPGVTVTLKGFATSMAQIEDQFTYLQVMADHVTLYMEDLVYDGIMRGDNGRFPDYNSHILDITADAEYAKITIKDSMLYKTGALDAVINKASNTIVTLDNSELGSRTPIVYEGGSGNQLYIENGSKIAGPATHYRDDAVIAIKGQTDFTIEVKNSEIEGQEPLDKRPIRVFAFDEAAPSSDVKINIADNSRIYYGLEDGKVAPNNIIFAFGENAGTNSAKVTIDGSSKIYQSILDNLYQETTQKDLPLEQWYQNVEGKAVIGIYNRAGDATIQIYNDGQTIDELENPSYNSADGYNFKGWFKAFDGENYLEEYTEPYASVQAGVNMNLYPKFVKKIEVTIGEGKFNLEEGDALGEKIAELDNKLTALQKEGMTFKGYTVYGETTSQTFDSAEAVSDYKPTENVKIEAIHRVTLTVNGKKFELDAGDTVAQIGSHDGYATDPAGFEAARLNGKDEDHFSRLVYVRNDGQEDGTFELDSAINQDTNLKTKHYAILTVEGQPFKVEQGAKISEDKDGMLVDTLKAIKERQVDYKTFDRFENDKGTEIKIEEPGMYVVPEDSEDMTISPKYHVRVDIGDKHYEFDEGGKLNDLTDNLKEIKDELGELVTGTGTQNFKGFVIASQGGTVAETIPATKETASEKYAEILDRTIDTDTKIYAEYNVEVTIKCPNNGCDGDNEKRFQIDTGQNLKKIEENDAEGYKKAKLQNYLGDEHETDRFVKFEMEDGEEFSEEQPVDRSITLTPKYYMMVTIDDERGDVRGTYKVEQGKTIDQMVPLSGEQTNIEDVLSKLRQDIVPQDVAELEAKDLHFEKLVKAGEGENGEAFTGEINEDIEIKSIYHYDVVVVEKYDNPGADLGDVDAGRYGFKVYQGKNLASNSNAETALDKLTESANRDDKSRIFVKFMDTKTGLTYDKETILDKVFDRHVYINAQVAYRVKIENDDTLVYVVNGEQLKSEGLVEAELNDLANQSGKHLETYTLDGKDIARNELLESRINNAAVKVGAKYYVEVKIGAETFKVPENGSLGDLTEQKDEIVKALQDLQKSIEVTGQSFSEYSVGKDAEAVLKYQFATDTEIVGKGKIDVIIDGIPYRDNGIEAGDTILKIGEEVLNRDHKNKYDPDKVFSRFVVKDTDETFDEKTPLSRNIELETKYAFKVTIEGDDSYRLEEGTPLNQNEKIAAKIAEFENNADKTFLRLEDENGNTVAKDKILSAHTTIIPVYGVTITIEGQDFLLEENSSLGKMPEQELNKLKDYLATLDTNLSDRIFDKYVVDGHQLTREELLDRTFTDNAVVTVKYNVKVTLGDSGVILPQGSKVAESNELKNAMANFVVPSNKSSIAGFMDDKNRIIDDNTAFEVNAVLTPQYNVKVYIVGTSSETNGEEIPENSPVSVASQSIAELEAKDQSEQKRFNKVFVKEDLAAMSIANLPTGSEVKVTDTIDENIKLNPKYVIDVKVEGDKTYTMDLDENAKLSELEKLGWQRPAEFKEFRDLDNNEAVIAEDTLLEKHTHVRAVYNVVVTLPDGTEVRLESGKPLSELSDFDWEGYNEDENGRKLSRFMDANTGATITKDTLANSNIKIVPKYLNQLIVFRTNDEGEAIEPEQEIVLEEGLPMSKLSGPERDKLNQWINGVKEVLAAEGKTDYDVTQYIYNSLPVDENATLFDNGGRIEAVFAYSPKPVTPPTVDHSSNGTSNTTPKAPDTGSELTAEEREHLNVVMIVVASTIFVLGAFGVARKFKQD